MDYLQKVTLINLVALAYMSIFIYMNLFKIENYINIYAKWIFLTASLTAYTLVKFIWFFQS